MAWTTHDLSAFVDANTLYGSGAVAQYSGGFLEVVTPGAGGLWQIALPSLTLSATTATTVEITFESSAYSHSSGVNAFNLRTLASVDPVVESTILDDWYALCGDLQATIVGNVATIVVGPDLVDYAAEVVAKGYFRLLFEFTSSSPTTRIAQIRTLLGSETPTHTLTLDDGSDTWAVDITSLLDLTAGVGTSGYGRQDEFTQAQAATFSCTLKNNDGSLSNDGPGWDTIGWDTGPWGGGIVIHPGTWIRWTLTDGATTVDRFTGRITSLTLGWEGAPALLSSVEVSAVDVFADLSRRTLRSMLEESILLRSPSAYYTLGEAEGSTSAGDISGNQAAPLVTTGTGAAVVFGNGTGPADGLTAAQFTSANQFLLGPSRTTGTVSVGAWFATSSVSNQVLLAGGGYEITISGAHITGVSGGSTTATVNDGGNHFVMVTWDGTTATTYIDGASADTAAAGPSSTLLTLAVGNVSGSSAAQYTGTVSHVAVFPTALSAADVLAIYEVGVGVSETTDARLTRLASYAGITPTTVSASGQIMGTQATSGVSLFDALQACATAEGGVLFVDGSGVVTMQGRGYRAGKTTADFTAGHDVDPGTTVPWDTQLLYNTANVTRTGGATQVVANSTTLPDYPIDLELAVATDADALRAAQWVVAKHQETAPRMASLTFDPFTSPLSESMLSLQIGDRIALPTLPSQMWSETGDYVVEGWSENVTATSWSLSLNVVPWVLSEALVLDDATYGALDSYAIMN